jgi:hypothetical protein
MYDPFQSYAALSPYGGSPYGAPYYGTPNPGTINPLIGNPQAQQGYGLQPSQNFIHPQQLQLAAALASQVAIPQLLGLSPLAAGIQNPMVAALLQNPLIAAGLHAQFGQQFGPPQHSPYSQPGQIGGIAFAQGGPLAGNGYPLAPQSWVGQLGGQAYGQVHPMLAQLAGRPFQGQGFSPWGY